MPLVAADTEPTLSLVCARLRSAREAAGHTLDELAAVTGLSKAHLSRLETGERQPSVASLLTFAHALDVPVGWLLGETADKPSSPLAVFAAGRATHQVAGLTVTASSGYPGSSALDALRMRISPSRKTAAPACHRGEEWVYVAKGTLRLEYDGHQVLVPNDSCAHFNAELPHRLAADEGPCEVLVVTAQATRSFWEAHR